MSKFYIFRIICRIIGILSCVTALIGLCLRSFIFALAGFAALAVDIILMALKNRCPFCKKPLRIAPIKNDEFCPHCGCKIE